MRGRGRGCWGEVVGWGEYGGVVGKRCDLEACIEGVQDC